MTGLPEDDAYAVIDRALTHRILIRTDTGYAFRHALLRDALLDGLPGRRRALHRRAAQALQVLHGHPPGSVTIWCSGDQAAAVPWMLRAAETEAALGAYHDALATLATVRDRAHGADLARLLGCGPTC